MTSILLAFGLLLMVLLLFIAILPKGKTETDKAWDRYYHDVIFGDQMDTPVRVEEQYSVPVITNALELVHYRILMCVYEVAPCPTILTHFHPMHLLRLESDGYLARNSIDSDFYFITPDGQSAVEVWLESRPQE